MFLTERGDWALRETPYSEEKHSEKVYLDKQLMKEKLLRIGSKMI
jgi:hypothetical protein